MHCKILEFGEDNISLLSFTIPIEHGISEGTFKINFCRNPNVKSDHYYAVIDSIKENFIVFPSKNEARFHLASSYIRIFQIDIPAKRCLYSFSLNKKHKAIIPLTEWKIFRLMI